VDETTVIPQEMFAAGKIFKGAPEKRCQKSNAAVTGLLRDLLKDKTSKKCHQKYNLNDS